jgi:hypothetical protein
MHQFTMHTNNCRNANEQQFHLVHKIELSLRKGIPASAVNILCFLMK